MHINIDQGTDLTVEIEVTDGTSPLMLTGGEAVFSYKKGLVTVDKSCIITGNILSTKFTADETSEMSGSYTFEVKAKDIDGDIGRVLNGAIRINPSIIPNYGIGE